MLSRDELARFWGYVDKQGADACWDWTAGLNQSGYGIFNIKTKPVRAHRVMWALTHGEMPAPDLFVCHRCDNPRCVNPAHLFLGKSLDNVRDMIAKGRARSGASLAARTHCRRGHAYDVPNTRIAKDGSRVCRACERLNRELRRKAS